MGPNGPDALRSRVTGRVLLTGPTGYVGGRLLTELEARGMPVRCLTRRPESLTGRVGPDTEVVTADLLAPDGLADAMRGTDVAYYLVHSMGSRGAFADDDRTAALNFARAALEAGVRRIVYLGGLGSGGRPQRPPRQPARGGRVLRSTGLPVVELRAGIVIGSGSLSFEVMRAW